MFVTHNSFAYNSIYERINIKAIVVLTFKVRVNKFRQLIVSPTNYVPY